jgi:hypothetical protein
MPSIPITTVVNTVDTIILNVNGTLLEAIGVRNREESGKRVVQISGAATGTGVGTGTGNIAIPLTFYDHDYRLEDDEGAGTVVNLQFKKHLSMMDKWEVLPNFSGANPTIGTYNTITTLNPLAGSNLFNNFKYKWFYQLGASANVLVKSNYTSHGRLDYDGAGKFTYNYNNVGTVIKDVGIIVFLVWVENSMLPFAGWAQNNHIFVLNDGTLRARYGFYRVTSVFPNLVGLEQYPLSLQTDSERLFNVLDNALFDDGLGLPIGAFIGNHCIMYDLGYNFEFDRLGGSDPHVLGVTGYDNHASTEEHTYNDILLINQLIPTILNNGTENWEDQNGITPNRQNALMAFLAPIGNYIDFNVSGEMRTAGDGIVAGDNSMYSFNLACNCIGMTQYFGAEILKYYDTMVMPTYGAFNITKGCKASFNIKMHLRGLPVILARLYTETRGITFVVNPYFNPTEIKEEISLNSIDNRRRI